jgi:hypothetical protein
MPVSNPRYLIVGAGQEYADVQEFASLDDAKAAATTLARSTMSEVYVFKPVRKVVPTITVVDDPIT